MLHPSSVAYQQPLASLSSNLISMTSGCCWSKLDQTLVTLQRITAPSKALCCTYPRSNPSQSVRYHYSGRVKTPQGRIKSDALSSSQTRDKEWDGQAPALIHQKLGLFTCRHHPLTSHQSLLMISNESTDELHYIMQRI